MIWLYTIGPLVVLGGALWLAVSTRGLVEQRLDRSVETFSDLSGPVERNERSTAGLADAMRRLTEAVRDDGSERVDG